MCRILFRNLCYLLVSLVIVLPCLNAQERFNSKEQLLDAESNFLYEEYSEALPVYMKLKDRYPDNAYLDYKIGRCYLNLPADKQKSLDYLQHAILKISITNKDGSFKQNEVPLDVIFYLGDAYRINNQLEKAIETYQEFKKKSDTKTYNLQLVEDQIQACKRAIQMEKRPVDISKLNLGEIINTRFSNIHPVVSEDESILMYATLLPFYQAVFFTKKINGNWQQPVNIIPDLGIDGDCLPTCLSSNGTEAYFYRSNEFRGDLYVSNFINGKWTKIRKLNDNINTRYWESHASLSHDGKTLYFTSNRPGGMGGLDIYKSQRTSGDNWGPAQNLGPVINSSYNEDSPFITADGKRLYFSSFGHETMGGFDIFYSDMDANGNWMKPVNLGFPINTTGDELFLCPVMNGKFAYLSEIDPNGFGKYDIVRMEIFDDRNPRIYNISGNIKRSGISLDQKILLVVVGLTKRDTVYSEILAGDSFHFHAKAGNYEIQISSPGYQSQSIPLSINYGSKEIEKSLNLMMDVTPSAVLPISEYATANPSVVTSQPNIRTSLDIPENKNSVVVIRRDTTTLKIPDANSGTNIPNVTNKSEEANKITAKGSNQNNSKNGFWQSLQKTSWEYIAIPGSLIVLILFLLILKKRRKSDKN